MKSMIKTNSIYLVLLLTSIDIIYSGCCCKKKPSNDGRKTNSPGKPGPGPGKPNIPVFDPAFSAYLRRLAIVVDGYIKSKITISKFNVFHRLDGMNGKIYIVFGKFQAYSADIKSINEIDVSDSNAVVNLPFELTIGSFVNGSNYNFEDGRITLQALCGHINALNSKDNAVYVENNGTHYLEVSVHTPSNKSGEYITNYIDLSDGALYTINKNVSSNDTRNMLRYRYYGSLEQGENKGQKKFVTSLIGYVKNTISNLGEYRNTSSGRSDIITQNAFRNFLTTDKNLTKAANIASLSIKFNS